MGAKFDIASGTKSIVAYLGAPVAAGSSGTSTIIDTLGFGSVTWIGSVIGTAENINVKLEESDDGSNWNDVDLKSVIRPEYSAVTAPSGYALQLNTGDKNSPMGYIGYKRYIRSVFDVENNGGLTTKFISFFWLAFPNNTNIVPQL